MDTRAINSPASYFLAVAGDSRSKGRQSNRNVAGHQDPVSVSQVDTVHGSIEVNTERPMDYVSLRQTQTQYPPGSTRVPGPLWQLGAQGSSPIPPSGLTRWDRVQSSASSLPGGGRRVVPLL